MKEILDGCQATAKIAYKCSQIIPIYPITPSTPMSEMATSMQKHKQKNVFRQDVKVIEMQSEGGVSGTLHGAILGKALSTTFTSSQGLLLMLPNLLMLYMDCFFHIIVCVCFLPHFLDKEHLNIVVLSHVGL